MRAEYDDAPEADEQLLLELGELIATVDPAPPHLKAVARDAFLGAIGRAAVWTVEAQTAGETTTSRTSASLDDPALARVAEHRYACPFVRLLSRPLPPAIFDSVW